MKILRNLAVVALLSPTSAFAQVYYGNADEVPLVDGIGLLLISVILAAVAVWALRRNGGFGGHAAGMLLAAGALVSAMLGAVGIQNAIALPGLNEYSLDNPNGGSAPIMDGINVYQNTTSVPLVILRIDMEHCELEFNGQSLAPAAEFQPTEEFPDHDVCEVGMVRQPQEYCQLECLENRG